MFFSTSCSNRRWKWTARVFKHLYYHYKFFTLNFIFLPLKNQTKIYIQNLNWMILIHNKLWIRYKTFSYRRWKWTVRGWWTRGSSDSTTGLGLGRKIATSIPRRCLTRSRTRRRPALKVCWLIFAIKIFYVFI